MTKLWAWQDERAPWKERIDGRDYSFEEYERCLHEISHLNDLFGGFQLTFRGLKKIEAKTQSFANCAPDRPLRILDIGYGSGETMRRIYKWLQSRGVVSEILGMDIQPWCQEIARKATPGDWPLQFQIGDYRKLHGEFDLVINSLMTHHLSDSEIVELLHWMNHHARYGWVINDLQRHPIPFWFIRIYTRALRYTSLVQSDSSISIARAFRREDWSRYLHQAGIAPDQSSVFWHWSFRYGVVGWSQ